MKTIFSKPTKALHADNIYEQYNLTENPFPLQAFINQNSSDIRQNGDIYESTIRSCEYSKIEENFLRRSQSDPNHLRIGYLLDASYVGRGNGKSTFALNLIRKINESYCLDISANVNKCFGIYIVPEAGGKTRTFSNMLDLCARSIFTSSIKIIDYSLAALRAQAIIELYGETYFQDEDFQDEVKLIENLNNLDWFSQKGLTSELNKINSKVGEYEFYNQISSENPLSQSSNTLFESICTTAKLIEYYKSLKKDIDKINFIFNDLVYLFMAAGFNGAYIIVDDFERIPDFQSDRQKRDFAIEVRSNFFDGTVANAKYGFYNIIFMLHAGVPRLIEKAWTVSGMEQRSSIVANSQAPHMVLFNKLDKASAISLIRKYMNEFRKAADHTVHPFTEGSIERIGELKEYNAAQILSTASMILEQAAKNKIKSIDVGVVNNILQKDDVESADTTSIVDESSEDLMQKL